MLCPECNHEISGKGSHYTCGGCGQKWKITFSCEVCGNLPTIIPSCGAVSFFCESCKSVKSRESMNKEFVKDSD